MRLRKVVFVVLSLVLLSMLYVKEYSALSADEALGTYQEEIIKSSRKTGVWASVTAAQFILEGGDPVSDLALEDNNYFGIKWKDEYSEIYPGSYEVKYMTKEADEEGNLISQPAWFTHFPTVKDSITEHSVIWWNGYYKDELELLYNLSSSRDDFVNAVGKGAYATDPKYTYKLKRCIADYHLDQLDKIAFPDGRKYCGNRDKIEGTYNYPNDGYNSKEIMEVADVYEQNGKEYVIVDSKSPLPVAYTGIDPDQIESSSSENKILKRIRLFIEQKLDMDLTTFFHKLFLIIGVGLFVLATLILFLSGYDLVTDSSLLSKFSLNIIKRDSSFITQLIYFIVLVLLGMCFMIASYLVDINK